MITFILTHKERKVSSVAMLVSFMGRKYKLPTGESVPVASWNDKTKRARIKAGKQDLATINYSLDKWQIAGERALKQFHSKFIIPERDEMFYTIQSIRHGHDTSEETLLVRYFDVFIDRYSGLRAPTRIKQYRLVQRVLTRYEKDTKRVLRFDDIDMGFHSSFSKWFAANSYSPNYLGDCLKIIRTVMRDAEELDRLHENRIPYSKMFTIPSARVDNIYLTEDELVRMYRLDITQDLVASFHEGLPAHKVALMRDSLVKARDLFLVGAFTGLRFSDSSKLTKNNIKDGFFEVYNRKTDVMTVIPIHWVIEDMLKSGYDFSTRMYDQKLNKHIKEVAKMAGITEPVTLTRVSGKERVSTTKPKCDWVTSHTARRSFATNAYLAGIPTISIMKITGHKRESTFMAYIKVGERENAERISNMEFFTGKNAYFRGTECGPTVAPKVDHVAK